MLPRHFSKFMRSIQTKLTRSILRRCLKACFKAGFSGGIALLALAGGGSGAIAQINPTAESTNTAVTSDEYGNRHEITGGVRTNNGASDHNLFHSFDQFDLEAGQTATFIASPETQNILSHILGSASSIDGRIQIEGSSANLYLVNPAGILFGPNAQLNLPGNLTATTATAFGFGNGQWLDFTDTHASSDYESRLGYPTAFRFDTAGAVSNAGLLQVDQGQYISLVGGSVLNAGTLMAPGGALNLAAVEPGSLIRLSQQGQLLSLEISPEYSEETAEYIAASSALPQSLSELLTGDLSNYADMLVVDAAGTVRLVNSSVPVPGPGGAIASGSLSADSSSGVGGSINLIGTRVGVTDATLSASGETGGGILRIGGGYLEQVSIPTADQTYVDRQSTLTADALETGNGGQIYVHSDRVATQFYGELSAQGGRAAGDGGSAEIASANRFTYAGTASLTAAEGAAGNILFSAYDTTIKDGASPELPSEQGAHLIEDFFANPDYVYGDSPLYEQSLENLTNVTIRMLHNIVLEDLADNELSFAPGSHITFQADSDNDEGSFITNDLADTIQAAGGVVEIRAGNLAENADSRIVAGNIDVSAPDNSRIGEMTNGSIRLQSSNLIAVQNIEAGSGDIQLVSNEIHLGPNSRVGNATVTPSPSGSLSGGAIALKTNSLIANTSLTLSAESTITATGAINALEGADLTFEADSIATGNITSDGSDITLSSTNNITTGYISTGNSSQSRPGGNINISSAGSVRVTDSILRNGVATSLEAPNGQITVRHGGNGETPFEVGNGAANGPIINGTAGQITDATVSFAGISISDRLFEGGIEISTDVPLDISSEIPAEVPQTATPVDITLPTAATVPISEDRSDINFGTVLTDAESGSSATETFNQIETSVGAQFEAFLSLDNREALTRVATLTQVQDTLRQASEKSSRVRSSLIYVYFVPDAADIASVKPDKNREPQPSDQLEIMLITTEGKPVRYRQWGVTRADVNAIAAEFRRQATSQFSTPAQYLPPAQQLYRWIIKPLEPYLSDKGTNNLAMIMDDGLRTLPLAALHDGDQFLVEKYSLGLLPTFSLTDFGLDKSTPEQEASEADSAVRVLAMGASQFTDQPPLPAVAAELSFISNDLRLGDAFLNERFTLENLTAKIASQRYGIVHLATHAVFEAGDRENSYIQLWDRRIGLAQFQALNFGDSDIDLIILSACSTAMGDRNSEYGFAGFAVSAGSQSALASLWPVSDEGTLGFMTQFYDHLPSADIRAEALRAAQIKMIQGDIGIHNGQVYGVNDEILATIPELAQSGSWTFAHPFYWSAFTMIGSPW